MITASKAMRNAAGLPIQCAAAQAMLENSSDQWRLPFAGALVAPARLPRATPAKALGVLGIAHLAPPVTSRRRPSMPPEGEPFPPARAREPSRSLAR